MNLPDQEQEWIKSIRESGRFDRDFYLRWYGDDPEAHHDPEQHYITVGEARGYWPCPGFCPGDYLAANQDVARAGVSPFSHYVTDGEREGRLLRPVPLLWRNAAGGLDFPAVDGPSDPNRKPRFAVVLHLFHYEMWPEFAERIRSLGNLCDLFITVTRRPNRDLDSLISAIRNRFPEAVIFPHPNHGRDIFPFLRLVNAGVLDGYQAVCKLHTKKSPHLKSGKAWGEHLADSLLPGPKESETLAKRFLASKKSGVLTADGQRKQGSDWWHGNRGRSLELLSRAGIEADPEKLRFPAGSMYWLKPPVISALRDLHLAAEDFEPEMGQHDATSAHAIERMIGYLAEHAGLEVVEIGELLGRPLAPENRDRLEFSALEDAEGGAERRKEALPDSGGPGARRPPISRHVTYEGGIDVCSLRGMMGWIREVSDRRIACHLRLTIDDTLVAGGVADQFREDIADSGKGDPNCGFVIPLLGEAFDGDVHGFQLTVIGDAWLWQSLRIPFRLARRSEIGEVTGISGGEIKGWCRDPLEPEIYQEVDLLIDGYFAGGSKSPRKKKQKRNHKFRLEIPPSFRDGREHDLEVIVRGSRIRLWEGTESLLP